MCSHREEGTGSQCSTSFPVPCEDRAHVPINNYSNLLPFLPGITESCLILYSNFMTSLKVASNPGPFKQELSDLTWPSPPRLFSVTFLDINHSIRKAKSKIKDQGSEITYLGLKTLLKYQKH